MQLILESKEELELLRIAVSDLSAKEKVEEINKIVNNVSDAKKTLLMYSDLFRHIYYKEDKIWYLIANEELREVDNKTLEIKK